MEGVYHFRKETVQFIAAIECFFAADRVEHHLMFLKNWLNPPQNETDYSPQQHPAQLFGFYEKLLPLFEYTDLLFNQGLADPAFVKAIEAAECHLEKELILLDYWPKLLSNEEMQQPKLVFLDVFCFHQLASYKIIYKDWLFAGLAAKLDQEWDPQIYQIYENTKKMLEACWLIHERIISRNSFKSIDRQHYMAVFESTSPLVDQLLFANPFSVIEAFFNLDNLEGHKTYLKNWYRTALAEGSCVSSATDYFYLYNQFTQLLNAGYLIAEKKLIYETCGDKETAVATESDWLGNPHFKTAEMVLPYGVNALPERFAINPYQFIEYFFVPAKIKQLRVGLLEWLYAAFSMKSSIKILDKEFLFEQYENMLMVIEAFFLIINNPLAGEIAKEERGNYA
ncbi:hypothetical protein ACS5PU_11785 [Pedobacter sp. GSP4]|uniref:hypothetical protein n=1 Tax=Pedobacter sp. GSP4 TaxID=3453716 RepID=UPI003EED2EA7